MEFIAHRGMPRLARENTLASFDLALQAGADGIELDVHVSADAVVVVHHDAQIAGPNSAAIESLLRSDLARLGIPTLHEVCDLVGTRATLYVEAKAPRSAASIIDCLTAHEVRAAVHSFDVRVSRQVNALAPTIPVGLLIDKPVDDAAALVAATAIRDLWPNHQIIDRPLVAGAHSAGARVIAWTVNDPGEARRLRELGVDALCSDDVRAARAALRLG